MITRMLVYVAVVIAGAVINAAVREWLGTEIKHRSPSQGIVYSIISALITIAGWEVLTWALSGAI